MPVLLEPLPGRTKHKDVLNVLAGSKEDDKSLGCEA
jgi:hypothetical protein